MLAEQDTSRTNWSCQTNKIFNHVRINLDEYSLDILDLSARANIFKTEGNKSPPPIVFKHL